MNLFKKILGLAIVTSPFTGLFILIIRDSGILVALQVFGSVFLLFLIFSFGFYLLESPKKVKIK